MGVFRLFYSGGLLDFGVSKKGGGGCGVADWRYTSGVVFLPAVNDLTYGKFVVGWIHNFCRPAISSRVFTRLIVVSIYHAL